MNNILCFLQIFLKRLYHKVVQQNVQLLKLLFFVMAFSTSLGFIFLVSRSTSINTGSQPHSFTTFAVETHVKEGIITSPLLILFDHKANSRADVQEFTATAYLVPMNFANSISNILLYFPCANHPDLNEF